MAQENLNEIEELKKKCEEYLGGWKRERADFINYKKEESERVGCFLKYANEELLLKILPILDNIYLAEKELPEKLEKESPSSSLGAAQDSSGQTSQAWKVWTEGFLQIKTQLLDFLQKEGIEEIKTIGEKFNPSLMEVSEEVESKDGKEAGTVLEEVQKGYTLHAKTIRPAKVRISK